MFLEKIIDDSVTGTVIQRSKMHRGPRGIIQVMFGAEWMVLVCKRISSLYGSVVPYLG